MPPTQPQHPPTPNTSPIATPPQQRSSIGPVAGIVIVILLLAAGGLYFYGAYLNKQMDETPYIPGDENLIPANADSDTSSGLPPQSDSDDVSSIEADFNAMNMNQMDAQTEADLSNIE